MEVPLQPFPNYLVEFPTKVSILVLMEVPLQLDNGTLLQAIEMAFQSLF